VRFSIPDTGRQAAREAVPRHRLPTEKPPFGGCSVDRGRGGKGYAGLSAATFARAPALSVYQSGLISL
jgi:hypothetical protein